MLRWSTMQLRSWCAAQLQQQPGWARCRQICWRASAARAQTSHAAACCGVDEDESCNVLVRRRRGGGGVSKLLAVCRENRREHGEDVRGVWARGEAGGAPPRTRVVTHMHQHRTTFTLMSPRAKGQRGSSSMPRCRAGHCSTAEACGCSSPLPLSFLDSPPLPLSPAME